METLPSIFSGIRYPELDIHGSSLQICPDHRFWVVWMVARECVQFTRKIESVQIQFTWNIDAKKKGIVKAQNLKPETSCGFEWVSLEAENSEGVSDVYNYEGYR